MVASWYAGIHDTSEVMFLHTQQRWIRKISSRRAMKRQASTVIRAKPRRNWERYFLDIKINSAVAQIRSLANASS
jgi:hypothetical protein